MTHRFSIFKERRTVLFIALGVSIALLVGSAVALYFVLQPSAQSPNGRKKNNQSPYQDKRPNAAA